MPAKFPHALLIALLGLSPLACGDDDDDGGNNDDAGTNTVDASLLDARPTPDAAQPACTPTNGTNIALEEVASGFDSPVFLDAPAGDRRLFVVDQPGVIWIVNADDNLVTTPFLDIRDKVNDGPNEAGLLGLAFHPDWPTQQKFYVNYTRGNLETVVAEYQVSSDPNVADADSERVLLTQDQPFGNHNGGMIAFGPDDLLYIGLGDGGSGGDPLDAGQSLDTLLGKVLRIDVTGDPYTIPSTNPFVGGVETRDEIWAYGLRNPWRFSFDSATGDLYIGDVGQGGNGQPPAREEINFQPASSTGGENYGWNFFEGDNCREGATACGSITHAEPALIYMHSGGRCSITGGYVYRGTCLPDLQGHYFYGDFCTGEVLSFEIDNGSVTNETDWTTTLDPPGSLTAFGTDGFGELYILFRSTDSAPGRVFRVVAAQ